MRDGGLGHEERAVEVHAQHPAVPVLGHVSDVLGPRDAGDVAQHVELAERVDAFGDRGEALVALRDVAHACAYLTAGLLHERDGLGEPLGADVEQEQLGAFFGEPHRASRQYRTRHR